MTANSRTVRDLHTGETAVLGVPLLDRAQAMRLAELGLRAGERITLAQRGVGGARVVSVGGSRIALDGRTSERLPLAGEGPP